MPEKNITHQEYKAVRAWVDSREVRERGDVGAGVHEADIYIVDGEPLVLRGYFTYLLPWSNLLKLNFKMVKIGKAYLACSYNHARELEEAGILKFW